MNIGVSIRCVTNELTGIGRYATCILDELQRIDVVNNYYLMECKPSGYAPINPKWEKVCRRSNMPGQLWMQTIVPALIKEYNIDVFWSPEIISPFWGVPANTKVITTVHDFVMWRYPATYGLLFSIADKIMFAGALKRSAALIPVSEYTKNELIRWYPALPSKPKIIRTINNASKNWDVGDKSIKRGDFLFFPGNLDPRKNLHRLINALEIINAEGTCIDLHICGPKRWKRGKSLELDELIKSSPVKNRIKYLGYISDDELMNQYLSCKAVIFPSIYEGFGLPVLEALKLNTPVLTSKGTVMEEIAGENALYFDPHDVNSIAGTIREFLNTGGPAINQTRLERYCWKQSARSLLELFTEVNNKECT